MIKTWLDTDIGVDPDDMFALSFLLSGKGASVDYVSVTYQNLDKKLAIADKLLAISGLRDRVILLKGDIPSTFKGQTEGYLTEDLLIDAYNIDLPAMEGKVLDVSSHKAVDDIRLCAIGPFTTTKKIVNLHAPSEVWMTAGSFVEGSPYAEYNVRSDVESFKEILESKSNLFLMSRGEFMSVPIQKSDLLKSLIGSKFESILEASLNNYQNFLAKIGGNGEKVILGDLLTVVAMTNPNIFEFVEGVIDVDPDGKCFFKKGPGKHHLIKISDGEKVLNVMMDLVAALENEMSKENTPHNMLTVVGGIGVGKSTITEKIVDHFGLAIIDADDYFLNGNPFKNVFLENPERWSFANEVAMLIHRSDLLKAKLLELSGGGWVVVDSGLLMSFAYANSHKVSGCMKENEWNLFERLFGDYSEGLMPNFILWLNYSVDTQIKRIEKRGIEFEMDDQREYLTNLNLGIGNMLAKVGEMGVDIVEIKEQEVVDFVLNPDDLKTILRRVEDRLK